MRLKDKKEAKKGIGKGQKEAKKGIGKGEKKEAKKRIGK